MVNCNLCGMKFNDDDFYIEERKKAHQIWHSPSSRRRNTILGNVIWLTD